MPKYRSIKTVYNGRRYDSRLEADVSRLLDLEQRAGIIQSIEYQVPIRLRVNDSLICTYVADFRVTRADGTVELVEAKGKALPTWRLKEKLTRALYPDLPIRVVTREDIA